MFLSGHGDTVFTKLGGLKKGDTIVFSTPYGDFVYEATGFKIVKETDPNIVVPSNHETLTLSTCYSFIYFGFAPDRYIVYTKLVSESKAALEATATQIAPP